MSKLKIGEHLSGHETHFVSSIFGHAQIIHIFICNNQKSTIKSNGCWCSCSHLVVVLWPWIWFEIHRKKKERSFRPRNSKTHCDKHLFTCDNCSNRMDQQHVLWFSFLIELSLSRGKSLHRPSAKYSEWCRMQSPIKGNVQRVCVCMGIRLEHRHRRVHHDHGSWRLRDRKKFTIFSGATNKFHSN